MKTLDDILCPVCGYYCLGNGGQGCIDKLILLTNQREDKNMYQPIICVDFDGVIHSYKSGWKGVANIPDPPVKGAIKWLEDHLQCPDSLCAMAPKYRGPVVQIYSSRSKSWRGRRAMKKWLVKHGLHPGYINENILKFPVKNWFTRTTMVQILN